MSINLENEVFMKPGGEGKILKLNLTFEEACLIDDALLSSDPSLEDLAYTIQMKLRTCEVVDETETNQRTCPCNRKANASDQFDR